jgi:predicted porin
MKIATLSRTKLAVIPAALAFGLFASGEARADVTIASADGWSVFTAGRVSAFFSYGQGDSNPTARPGETLPDGAGLDPGDDTSPAPTPTGQGTFKSMRVRSGFIPNVFSMGLTRNLNDETTLKAFFSLWATVDTEGLRKTNPVFADAREGYLKVDGKRWGSVTAGKQLELFSRGAVQNDFLYHDGYALGFPGVIDTNGPTNGMIGFGVLAAFFSAGIMYATPTLAGFQLSVGLYDPTNIPGTYDQTRYGRVESELTYDLEMGWGRLHVFGNYGNQALYKANSNVEATAYGAGYGARFEAGPAHLGVAGHYGKGLGLDYAFQPSDVTVAEDDSLRTFEGYSVLGQVVAGPFDINLGWGLSRALPLAEDIAPGANVSLPTQQAVSGGVVWHASNQFHFDVDYIHVWVSYSLGEKQVMDFINSGPTVTW